ncbi:amidohydrolase [Polynucleobacter sp. MWH-Adler-W8]|uniref:amidohydrolase n=1 Tax=Polynucleobacter sp. MWH-Adler-W8 TaxID=1819727 RepID=UPI00092C8005|nr:amidohydrolase [Polynucleobacter sp. MWH-Adler-W8]OJI04976.1 hypothetical protein AOC28_05765 [Polynucleobacter sp. MWH-Adler-W8]
MTSNQTLYFNGNILTMAGDQPEYVEAVLVKDGKIAFTGSKQEANALANPDVKRHDLQGHTLTPGFIDTWGHFGLFAQQTLSLNVGYFADNPPRSRSELIAQLKKDGKLLNGWLIAAEYMDGLMKDGPLTIADLDAAFPDTPVLVQNISTLAGLFNTAGLKKLGITADTKVESGAIVVDPTTHQMTGIIIGLPYLNAVAAAYGQFSQDLTFKTYQSAEKIYASYGTTTAQHYQASPEDIQLMRLASDSGVISIDLIALPMSDTVDTLLQGNPNYSFGVYSNVDRGFKVAGILMSTDGGPQLKLAYLSKPYNDTTGFPDGWRGMAYYTQDQVDHYAKLAYEKNIPFFCYSNGDAGIDMALAAIKKAIAETGITEDRRSTISHSFFAREDQLDDYKANHIIAITLSNHIWLYGDIYLDIVGEERADYFCPMVTAHNKGIVVGIHNDVPSSGPDCLFTIWSAVNRKTMSGKTLGTKEKMDPYLALQAFTSNAAYVYREENTKGKILPGMLADLVELDQNPLTIDPDAIKDIKVVNTIKNGKVIYSRNVE